MSAFTPNSDPDRLKSLDVELTPRQVAWLNREAEKQSLSVDRLVRSIITAQIRSGKGGPVSPSGEGVPQSSRHTSTSAEAPTEDASEDENTSSIVESLRSTTKQLEDLTEDEVEADPSDLSDTLARIQARVDDEDGSDERATRKKQVESVLLDRQKRSMFDLVEEE